MSGTLMAGLSMPSEQTKAMKQSIAAERGLLASLRAPRQSRALGGKLKAVTVPSSDEYEHLTRAVQVRDAPLADVRSLPQEVRPAVGAPLAGIRAMREDRRRRHDFAVSALEDYEQSMADKLVGAANEAVTAFIADMSENDSEIDGRLERLKNLRIAEIDESGIQNVFDFMLQQRSVRSAIFDKMLSFLSGKDKECREYADTTIYNAIEALSAAAHIPDTAMQRLIEELTHRTNTTILGWRKANADLVRRLRVRDVEMERARRVLSSDILTRWRRDRSDHAITVFCRDLEGEDFMRPHDRTLILDEIKRSQRACLADIVAHVESAAQLLPLRLRRSVDGWGVGSDACVSRWHTASLEYIQRMEAVEAGVQERVRERFASLVDEIKRYGHISDDEVQAYVQKEGSSSMTKRQDSARRVIALVRSFVDEQCDEWTTKLRTLVAYMERVVGRREAQREAIHDINDKTKCLLVEQRAEHERERKENERQFDAIISEIQVATSESIMDKKVEDALSKLDVIEESYRAFHALSSATLKEHVEAVRAETDSYEKTLCELLGLVKQKDSESTSPALDMTGRSTTMGTTISTASGDVFVTVFDLHDWLFTKSAIAGTDDSVGKTQPSDDDKTSAADEGLNDGEPGRDSGGDDLLLGTDADAVTGADEASAADSSPASAEEVASYLVSPETSEPYTEVQAISMTLMSTLLSQLRVSMLDDMCTMSDADVSASQRFCSASKEVMTNELDTLLRAHRPRAGRVEEEVRQECSVKLIQLRRKFDRQLRRAVKQLSDNDQRVGDSLTQLSKTMAKQIWKLDRLEGSLASCMSVKSLTTRVREARSTRDQIREFLRVECEAVREFIAKQAEDVTGVKDNLHTYLVISNDGDEKTMSRDEVLGQEGYEEIRTQLEQFSLAITRQTERELDTVKESEATFVERIDESFGRVEAARPHHETDLQFLEEFDSIMCTTTGKVKELISSGEVEMRELHNDVEGLRECMQQAGQQGAGTEDDSCQEMMSRLDKLRLRLLLRCKSLKYIQSSVEPVAITHTIGAPGAGEATAGTMESPTRKSPEKQSASKAAGKDKGSKVGGKQQQNPSSKDDTSESSSSLLSTVDMLCQECSASLEETAKTFYDQKQNLEVADKGGSAFSAVSKKQRTRIPDSLEDFNTLCSEQLSSLRRDARQHVSQSVRTLHDSVMEVAALIARVPHVTLRTLLSGKQTTLETSLKDSARDFQTKRDEYTATLDSLKSRIRIVMARIDHEAREGGGGGGLSLVDASHAEDGTVGASNVDIKEQLRELLAEEEREVAARLDLEKEEARLAVRMLCDFERDFCGKLQSLLGIIVEEMGHIVHPEDLPQEHAEGSNAPSAGQENSGDAATGAANAQSLWSAKRKGLKKLLRQKAFSELGENAVVVEGRPLRQLTWRVQDMPSLVRSLKVANLMSSRPMRVIVDENIEESNLDEVGVTPTAADSESTEDAKLFSVTGLDCACVHALLEARDEALLCASSLMTRVYAEHCDALLSNTTAHMTQRRDTLKQRQQQKTGLNLK